MKKSEYIHITELIGCPAEINTTLRINYTPIKIKENIDFLIARPTCKPVTMSKVNEQCPVRKEIPRCSPPQIYIPALYWFARTA